MTTYNPTSNTIHINGIKDVSGFLKSLQAHGTLLTIPDHRYIIRTPVGEVQAEYSIGESSFRATITKKPFFLSYGKIWDEVRNRLPKDV